MNNIFPLSIQAPESSTTVLTEQLVSEALILSRKSPRKRILQRLHKKDSDPFHRMLNVMQPGSYFRPHRHLNPPKSETLVMLQGAMRAVIFDETGHILEHHLLEAGGPCFGIDFLPTVYHTIIILEPDTVMFEAKTGPYTVATDKDFPDWAPSEGSPEAEAFLTSLMNLTDS